MQKDRILGCDFIRAISALGIIAHHLYVELDAGGIEINRYLGGEYANGNYGWLFVTLFLILSGAMLYENYPILECANLKEFYYKRWKSIFPAFYLAWLFFFIQNVFDKGEIFYNGSPLKLIWTVLGFDGYVSLKTSTYYILGEWFLGPIIVLYIIYPFILLLFRRSGSKKTALIMGLLFLVVDKYGISLQTGPFRSITSCLFSFILGMLIIEQREKFKSRFILGGFIAVSCICIFYKLPVMLNGNIFVHVFGGLLFISLLGIGEEIMKISVLNKMISSISRMSYLVFLVQHIVIKQIVGCVSVIRITAGSYLLILIITTMVILFYAWSLSQVNKGWLKSKFFRILESKI